MIASWSLNGATGLTSFNGEGGFDSVVNQAGAAGTTFGDVENFIDRPLLFIPGFGGSFVDTTLARRLGGALPWTHWYLTPRDRPDQARPRPARGGVLRFRPDVGQRRVHRRHEQGRCGRNALCLALGLARAGRGYIRWFGRWRVERRHRSLDSRLGDRQLRLRGRLPCLLDGPGRKSLARPHRHGRNLP